MLTEKQHAALSFIDGRISATGVAPSFEEIKDHLGLASKSGVHRLVDALVERGFLRRLPNRARALDVVRRPGEMVHHAIPSAANDVASVPMLGRIAAGVPIEAIASPERVSVPVGLIGGRVDYALEVAGDSMVGAGIHDGDLALIERTRDARDGEIVVALVHGAEATLKRLHRQGAYVHLLAENPSYIPMVYLARDVVVQGRLAGLVRRYH